MLNQLILSKSKDIFQLIHKVDFKQKLHKLAKIIISQKTQISVALIALLSVYGVLRIFIYPADLSYQQLIEIYSKPPEQWVKPNVDANIKWRELGILPKPYYPSGEPNLAKIALGKKLFFDPKLSVSGQIACVSCHHPDQRWTDNRKVSIGHDGRQGRRNAPTIANLSYAKYFFWDGRSTSLEQQALVPLMDQVEMNTAVPIMLKNVNAIEQYRIDFKQITGRNEISVEDITSALADFQRSVTSRPSRFDYFLAKRLMLNEDELRGLHLFRTKARCINCHNGPLFTDGEFHNVGLTYYGRFYQDLGRYNVTKNPQDIGKFKTPSLREVMRTRPWMHNGLFDRIDGVINMYNFGMPRPKPRADQFMDANFPQTSPILRKLNLTKAEKAQLKAFLQAISSP